MGAYHAGWIGVCVWGKGDSGGVIPFIFYISYFIFLYSLLLFFTKFVKFEVLKKFQVFFHMMELAKTDF